MPGSLLHENAAVQCPHGGQAKTVSTNKRVKVSGMAVALLGDTTTVAGCTFQVPGPKPQPCVTVKWSTPATRVKVMGQFVLLKSSSGVCESAEQAPQGTAVIGTTQTRVTGT